MRPALRRILLFAAALALLLAVALALRAVQSRRYVQANRTVLRLAPAAAEPAQWEEYARFDGSYPQYWPAQITLPAGCYLRRGIESQFVIPALRKAGYLRGFRADGRLRGSAESLLRHFNADLAALNIELIGVPQDEPAASRSDKLAAEAQAAGVFVVLTIDKAPFHGWRAFTLEAYAP